MTLQLPPLSLYVHMPWCVRKCPYCDFNSHAAPESIPQQQYIDALLEDLALDAARRAGPRARVGVLRRRHAEPVRARGGRALSRRRARAGGVRAGHRGDARSESRARSSTAASAAIATRAINRVSLGAQTFDAEQLRTLGRIHGSGDIARAVDELRSAGIDNFNLDLMYGLPAQTLQQALADLDAALALEPAHISHYQLTLEPGTVFYHRPPPLPDSDAIWQMQVDCQERLAARGYEHYEVSAYARAGRRSRHNLNYWQFGDYIGVGAGAHGKLTWLASASGPGRDRSQRTREAAARVPAASGGGSHQRSLRGRGRRSAVRVHAECAATDRRASAKRDFEARTGLSFATIARRSRRSAAQGPAANARAPGGGE